MSRWRDEQVLQFEGYVKSLNGFFGGVQSRASYDHMGAVVADSVLQAGIRYETVVQPRVYRIRAEFPQAKSVSGLLLAAREYGWGVLLNWRHPEKLRRAGELATFLFDRGLETPHALRAWVRATSNRKELLTLRGVGPKTADYIALLVGGDAIAVDRHVMEFARRAGVAASTYDDVRDIVSRAAANLAVRECDLDQAIWRYMANGSPSTC